MLNILQLLSQDSFIVYNKHIAHQYGVEEAIILGHLSSRYCYFESQKQLDNEGFFFDTETNRNQQTALTRRKQDRAIKNLEEIGFIETRLKGSPAKKHFRICTNKIVQNVQTRLCETHEQDCAKRTNINKKELLKKNKDKLYIHFFNIWNEGAVLIHRQLTDEMKKALEKRLKEYSAEELEKTIKLYARVLISEETYFTQRWSFAEFLRQKNAFPSFVGKRFEDYLKWDSSSPKNAHKQTEEVPVDYQEVSIDEL